MASGFPCGETSANSLLLCEDSISIVCRFVDSTINSSQKMNSGKIVYFFNPWNELKQH